MSPPNGSPAGGDGLTRSKAALVDAVEAFTGDALRDVWVLDQSSQEPLYLREDVADAITDVDVERYLDNERFGFVTRDTYDQLHYSDFGYTLRGFDDWELFRTFFVTDGTKVGILCSVDRREGGYDYAKLNEDVHALEAEFDASDFAPRDD